MNRLCVNFDGLGLVPVNSDEWYVFDELIGPPRRIGDDAIIIVNGKRVKVRLLKSKGMVRDAKYLVRLPE